jgi:prepilin-type N-terminal cleavage/methylation domain-containing protein
VSRAMSRPSGYTVVEVMMALAVLALGGSGVIAMQKATILANNDARNVATATTIAQSWMERLRADALVWNEPGGQLDLSDTEWLHLAKNGLVLDSDWFQPDAVVPLAPFPEGSPAADIMGADRFTGDAMLPAFCTQVRLERFSNSKTAALSSYYAMIRTEVRVYWDRSGQSTDCTQAPPAGFGAMVTADGVGGGVHRWGFVYLVSAVTENPAPY